MNKKGCWFEDETGRYFLATKDGHALREDVTIQGVEYWFDENAVMQTGLVTRPNGTFPQSAPDEIFFMRSRKMKY